MTKSLKTKKEIIELATDFNRYVRAHHWTTRYDQDTDSFHSTAAKLSPDARIHYVDDEFAFYTTPQGKVEGLFIEYFTSNFLSQQPKLKKVLSRPTKSKNALIKLRQNQMRAIAPTLEEAMKNSIAAKLDFS